VEATLTITLSEDGNIRVDGPIKNRMMCYGMLAIAGDLIRDFNTKEQPRVEPPPSNIVVP
jgi:hypothetical protein